MNTEEAAPLKKEIKQKEKHLVNWQNSRSAVAVMQNTKAYHMHLTVLSDQKANIVIAASSIIITVSLSQLGRLDGMLLYTLMVVALFITFALLFAILSVAPVFDKTVNKMSVDTKGFNPLFFGHFTDVSFEEFSNSLKESLRDADDMYDAMILDLYQMGNVLKQRKFKYLNISYKIFFAGILVGLIMFIIAIFSSPR